MSSLEIHKVPSLSSSGRAGLCLVLGSDFVRRTVDKSKSCVVNRVPLFYHAKEADLT